MLSDVSPSGSFAKGTANRSGTDIDLFISLSQNTPETLKQIYDKLFSRMTEKGYSPKRQNVSINVKVNGYDVDLVPARRQDGYVRITAFSAERPTPGQKQTWRRTSAMCRIAAAPRKPALSNSGGIKGPGLSIVLS